MFHYEDIAFRPVEKKDLESIRKLRNEPSTWIYLTDITQISPAMQEKWFEKISHSEKQCYYTVTKATHDFPLIIEGDFVGIIRMDEIDRDNRSVRVGCDVIPAERGKGYGTRILNAVLQYCFRQWGMHRVWLCVLEDNEIAIKLYKNVGFRCDGVLREAIFRNGKYNDYLIMSVLESEYRQNA